MPTGSPAHRQSRSRVESFLRAFSVLWYMLGTQRNSWIHSSATICVIALGLWLGLSFIQWAILVLTIGLVWMAEFVNTALEAVVDLASPDIHPLARVGKDVGAAAVLVAAITSVLVGLLILGPALWAKLLG